jgi:hypothetical protein
MNSTNPTGIPNKSSRKTIWFLGIANSIIIGILATWLILGNLLAVKQEKVFQAELEKLSKRFPKKEMNDSARQLDRLRSTLAIRDNKYEVFHQSLSDYLSAQIARPDNYLDELPESIHHYLKTHASDLNAIRKHILSNEIPNYCTIDLEKTLGNASFSFPSFWGHFNFNKILLVDALEASRIGDDRRAHDNLQAAWKINQSFYDCPYLVSLLPAIINSNLQTGVLRKVHPPSFAWEQRLSEANPQQYLLNSLESESFWSASVLRKLSPDSNDFLQQVGERFEASPLGKIQQFFQQPYFQLVSVAEQAQTRSGIVELSKQDICSLDIQAWLDKYPRNWWYSMDFGSDFLAQLQKPYKNLIHIELTQKIVKIKRDVIASKKAPQKIPGIEASKVCPRLRWEYETDGRDKISIRLQNPPKWFVITEKSLPLNYQLSVKDLLKRSSKRQKP